MLDYGSWIPCYCSSHVVVAKFSVTSFFVSFKARGGRRGDNNMGLSANSKLAAYSSYLIELSRGVPIIGHISVRGPLGSAEVDKSEHGLLSWI